MEEFEDEKTFLEEIVETNDEIEEEKIEETE